MLQKFKSMDELVEFLGAMEDRLRNLEAENEKLRTAPLAREAVDGNTIARAVARVLPQTNLLHPGFLKRAFTVWGHFFVANLIIGIIVSIAYFCLVMLVLGPMCGNLIQNR